MKKNILIDSLDFLGSFKKLNLELRQCLERQEVDNFEIVFTGSTILEWFKIIDRESQDLDILLYLSKSEMEDNIPVIDAIINDFYRSKVDYLIEKQDVIPTNNGIISDGYQNTDLLSVRIDGFKVDFIIKPIEKLDPKYIIDIGDISVSTADEIFSYKAKFDKEGDKFKEDYFNFFKKFNNMVFEGFKPDKAEEPLITEQIKTPPLCISDLVEIAKAYNTD